MLRVEVTRPGRNRAVRHRKGEPRVQKQQQNELGSAVKWTQNSTPARVRLKGRQPQAGSSAIGGAGGDTNLPGGEEKPPS